MYLLVIMNKFNRILLASGLAATASLMANSPAFADTTGKVDLSGIVPSTLTFTLTPESTATSFSLTPGATNQMVKIATITNAKTNSGSGLKINATSPTWGLRATSNPNESAGLAFGLAEAPSADATSPTYFSSQGTGYYASNPLKNTKTSASGVADDSSIFIGIFNVPSNLAPGDYTANVTFTATDN
ncbi:MAG: hypothetical protein WCP16_17595 [Pseudanabaena sp. ELA645]|jgi:hypothetical protein